MKRESIYIGLAITVTTMVACCVTQKFDTVAHESNPTIEELKKQDPRFFPPASLQKLIQAAEKGDGYAAWTLFCYYGCNHNPMARTYLLRSVELNVPEAQCTYYSFLIQSPDRSTREKAVIWLKKAVQQGYKPAEDELKAHEKVLKLAEQRHARD